MGHPEPASGVAALAKLLIAIQNGHIPGKPSNIYPIVDFICFSLANLHYQSPNTDIPGLTDGRLEVVTKKTA